MSSEVLYSSIYLSFPLILAGFGHMFVVKMNFLSFLKIPIAEAVFGKNKTWRGIVVIIVFSVIGFYLLRVLPFKELILPQVNIELIELPLWLFGALVGVFYALFELPNSFLKRRIGIPEGKVSARYPWFFTLIDQSDSVLGCLVVYSLFMQLPWTVFVVLLLLGTFIHLATNLGLWTLGLRKEPF